MMSQPETPLREGVRRLLVVARHEEWTLHRVLTAEEHANSGVKELVARSNAARRGAAHMLHEVAAGRPADGCAPPPPAESVDWACVHLEAHASTVALLEALAAVDEDQLAADPEGRKSSREVGRFAGRFATDPGGRRSSREVGRFAGRLATDPSRRRNHPQYIWRDTVISGAREPMLGYAQWHHDSGRLVEGLSVLSRWYEGVRGAGLPTKARSDASYDLACGLARAGRPDEAMEYLPDAFLYNDRAAVGVLKAWAREDPDLAPLLGRTDFRALVGAG